MQDRAKPSILELKQKIRRNIFDLTEKQRTVFRAILCLDKHFSAQQKQRIIFLAVNFNEHKKAPYSEGPIEFKPKININEILLQLFQAICDEKMYLYSKGRLKHDDSAIW